jgi:hypothetical protein
MVVRSDTDRGFHRKKQMAGPFIRAGHCHTGQQGAREEPGSGHSAPGIIVRRFQRGKQRVSISGLTNGFAFPSSGSLQRFSVAAHAKMTLCQ